MKDWETRLAELLRSCDYDTGSLSPADRAEVERLARNCHIELPRRGVPWPNIAGSDALAGPLTDANPRRG